MTLHDRGTVIAWNDDRGFGFIRPDAGGGKLFFHANDARALHRRPREHDNVWYRASRDAQGRPCALDVRAQGWPPGVSVPWPLVAVGAFVAALAALWWYAGLTPWAIAAYAAMSTWTALLYRSDKSRAARGGWRTPERVLHGLELAGGWPGALIAQQRYRHKLRKVPYQAVFWGIVALHLTALTGFAIVALP